MIGSIEHAQKFNEYIKANSNKSLLNKEENRMNVESFTEEELKEALQLGYFECVGSLLLHKQSGLDGYNINMGDLRDFIESWIMKLDSTINNRIIEPMLKHFNPTEYGNCFERKADLSKKILETQQAVESLEKLYKFILHRRILEGKDKQSNLNSNRLHMRDVADINTIERR